MTQGSPPVLPVVKEPVPQPLHVPTALAEARAAWSAPPWIVRWLTSHMTTSTARPQNPANVVSAIAVMIALTPRRSAARRRIKRNRGEFVYNFRDIGVSSQDTVDGTSLS